MLTEFSPGQENGPVRLYQSLQPEHQDREVLLDVMIPGVAMGRLCALHVFTDGATQERVMRAAATRARIPELAYFNEKFWAPPDRTGSSRLWYKDVSMIRNAAQARERFFVIALGTFLDRDDMHLAAAAEAVALAVFQGVEGDHADLVAQTTKVLLDLFRIKLGFDAQHQPV